jgi:hypothetical protein
VWALVVPVIKRGASGSGRDVAVVDELSGWSCLADSTDHKPDPNSEYTGYDEGVEVWFRAVEATDGAMAGESGFVF